MVTLLELCTATHESRAWGREDLRPTPAPLGREGTACRVAGALELPRSTEGARRSMASGRAAGGPSTELTPAARVPAPDRPRLLRMSHADTRVKSGQLAQEVSGL